MAMIFIPALMAVTFALALFGGLPNGITAASDTMPLAAAASVAVANAATCDNRGAGRCS